MAKVNKLFLDSSYVLALLNAADRFHDAANVLVEAAERAEEVVVTTHVLAEICDELARSKRSMASRTITDIINRPNVTVIHISQPDFWEAFELYCQRADKSWGLTDCISFKVMEKEGITAALTCDRHFEQAGFEALLLQDNV